MSTSDENQLWPAFVGYYQTQGVEPVLLAWQNQQAVDVNLVLLAIYLTRQGLVWHHDLVDQEYQQWMQQSVRPIREVRQQLKKLVSNKAQEKEQFRQQVKTLELASERYVINLLSDSLSRLSLMPAGEVLGKDLFEINLQQALLSMSERLAGDYADIKKDEITKLTRLLFN